MNNSQTKKRIKALGFILTGIILTTGTTLLVRAQRTEPPSEKQSTQQEKLKPTVEIEFVGKEKEITLIGGKLISADGGNTKSSPSSMIMEGNVEINVPGKATIRVHQGRVKAQRDPAKHKFTLSIGAIK